MVRNLPSLPGFAIAGLFFWAGVQWIGDHRTGGLLDLDEAAYFGIAVSDYLQLAKGGVLAWARAVTGGNIQAPLTTALASLIFAGSGLELEHGYFVPLASATIAILAIYWLTSAIAGPSAGLAAAALTATTPMIVAYSRSFHFAMPATAVLALTLLAAVKSGRFSKTAWSIAFGIFLGLMPLARTMTIAFIPGILAGAALNILSSPAVPPRLVRFAVGLGVAILTASTWLAFTWREVGSYLFGYGYGARAAEYGTVIPFFAFQTLQRAILLVANAVLLPHLVLIVLALFAGLLVAFRLMRQHGWKTGRHIASSPLLLLALTVFGGLAALVSSPNTGSAFVAPLLPPLIALAVCLAWEVSASRLYRTAALSLAMITAVVVALPFFGIFTLPQRAVFVPYLGVVGVSDNRGTIDIYLDSSTGPQIGHDKATADRWLDVVARTNSAISREGERGGVATGFRNGIYSVSVLGLNYLLETHSGRHYVLVDPAYSGNTEQGYRDWLTSGTAAQSNLLLTSPGEGDFGPPVDYAAVEAAARSVGFVPVDSWAMPTGRVVTLWKRP